MSNPKVLMKTSEGDILIELFQEQAPVTVDNFLKYVDEKHYDNTIFHRVIDGFMIQGGGFDKNLVRKLTREPIPNEADNGLSNDVGTIAMARTMVVDSATDQFYINVADNIALNHRGKTPQGYGYCVFGKVVEGLDVVMKISKTPTTTKHVFSDVPKKDMIILSVERVK